MNILDMVVCANIFRHSGERVHRTKIITEPPKKIQGPIRMIARETRYCGDCGKIAHAANRGYYYCESHLTDELLEDDLTLMLEHVIPRKLPEPDEGTRTRGMF